MKILFSFFIFFIILFSILLFTQYSEYQNDKTTLHTSKLQDIANLYESAISAYRINAKSMFYNIVMQEEVLSIMRQLPNASEEKITKLHYELHDLLKERYQNLKSKLDLRQLHFHQSDGRSFLRMHRPDKFGDPLFDIRYSVKIANVEKIFTEGFEEGRIFNGYRYVFPIIENGNHYGSVEISISINAIIKHLNHIYREKAFYFMIDKNVINKKVFISEKSNYLASLLHKDFVVDQEVRSMFLKKYESCLNILAKNSSLQKRIKNYDSLVTEGTICGENILVSFMPIMNLRHHNVAYLIVFETDDKIVITKHAFIYKIIFGTTLLLIVLFIIYYYLKRSEESKKESLKLDKLVKDKTKELELIQDKELENYRNIILALVNLTEERDTYTAGHTRRVATYAKLLATSMGFSKEDLDNIYDAAILHDIGKIVTPDSVLLKPGALTPREYKIIQEHVVVSESILRNINFPENIINIVKHHHERFDGSGYPKGIRNNEMPMLARILAVADTFDAMTTNRIYKPRKSITVSLKELNSLSGILYDPLVIKHALRVFKDINIDIGITQLPTSVIEQERLSHYFKDPLTNLYNMQYLNLILDYGINKEYYQYIYVLALKDFSKLNHDLGWEIGNKILIEFSSYLETTCGEALLFRIYGDDFVILSQKKLDIHSEKITQQFEKKTNFLITIELIQYILKNEDDRKKFIKQITDAIG